MMKDMLAADNWLQTELGSMLEKKFTVGMNSDEKKNWEATITG
jgi:hypothetical protein